MEDFRSRPILHRLGDRRNALLLRRPVLRSALYRSNLCRTLPDNERKSPRPRFFRLFRTPRLFPGTKIKNKSSASAGLFLLLFSGGTVMTVPYRRISSARKIKRHFFIAKIIFGAIMKLPKEVFLCGKILNLNKKQNKFSAALAIGLLSLQRFSAAF